MTLVLTETSGRESGRAPQVVAAKDLSIVSYLARLVWVLSFAARRTNAPLIGGSMTRRRESRIHHRSQTDPAFQGCYSTCMQPRSSNLGQISSRIPLSGWKVESANAPKIRWKLATTRAPGGDNSEHMPPPGLPRSRGFSFHPRPGRLGLLSRMKMEAPLPHAN